MSKTFYVAVGGLLLLLAATLAFLSQDTTRGMGAERSLWLSAALGALGSAAIANGLRNPLGPQHRLVLRRKFNPVSLIIGPAVVVASLSVLYVFLNVVNVMPKIVVLGALLGVPGGVFITASVFAFVCVRCGSKLTTGFEENRAVDYCPTCRAVAVYQAGGTQVVLRDDGARALIEKVLEQRRSSRPVDSGRVPELPSTPSPSISEAAPKARSSNIPAAILSLLLGLGMTGYAVMSTRERSDANGVWTNGQDGRNAKIVGQVKASRVFSFTIPLYTYNLELTFLDAEGRPHKVKETIASYFEGLDTGLEPRVRYDATDPSRAVSSWSESLTYGPRLAAGWGFIAGLLMVAFGLKLLLAAKRES